MSSFTTQHAPGTPRLPDALRLGPAELTVTDLARSIAFYEGVLGFRVHRVEDGVARLGAGDEDVLVLVEERTAGRAGRHAGLYHVALLYPSRLELARAGARLAVTQTPIQGASDHKTHEAIYLADPDGNGLELAADRPREAWPTVDEAYGGGPLPLDTDSLLGLVDPSAVPASAEPGLAVGHLHLHVGNVEQGLAYYRDVVGFDLIANLGSAAFVSAGGYHHHLGFNVWRGEGVPAAPANVVGLPVWTVLLPTADDVAELASRVEQAGHPIVRNEDGSVLLTDPWGIRMRVATA